MFGSQLLYVKCDGCGITGLFKCASHADTGCPVAADLAASMRLQGWARSDDYVTGSERRLHWCGRCKSERRERRPDKIEPAAQQPVEAAAEPKSIDIREKGQPW